MSEKHNEAGNKLFKIRDYEGAIKSYSAAIRENPRVTKYYTNRAMSWLNLSEYEKCIQDCDLSLALDKNQMKPYYMKGCASLALGRPNEAYPDTQKAYTIALKVNSPSLPTILANILRCKKERWEHTEKRKAMEENELLNELIDLLEDKKTKEIDEFKKSLSNDKLNTNLNFDGKLNLNDNITDTSNQLEDIDTRQEIVEISKDYKEKENKLVTIFKSANTLSSKKEEVPDWIIDPITFEVMVDPVISPSSGVTYERSSIEKYLLKNPQDPLTRQPLTSSKLIPNLALKEAIDAYLSKNGWAIDY